MEISELSPDEDLFLRIGAVTSNVRVWINGKDAGYSEDSRLDAVFDVTDLVRPGVNVIALEVMRWCDGTYLEDQDCWRMSGISRSVGLVRRPKARLEDINVTAGMDGTLSVKALTTAGVGKLTFRLLNPDGRRIRKWALQVCAPISPRRIHSASVRSSVCASFSGRAVSPYTAAADADGLYFNTQRRE